MKPARLVPVAFISLVLCAAALGQTPGPHADEPAGPSAATDPSTKPTGEGDNPAGAKPDSSKPAVDQQRADKPTGDKAVPATSSSESICLMIESAAQANGIPVDFFARVIWRESRFQPNAVGPVTRSGAQAQGIAQFMPQTAAEHQLLDPFDPVQALPKSAEFLRQLFDEFGNLGLAAAGYNAGPRRVHDWLAGRGSLPGQTRAYVLAVTGRPAEDWSAGRAAQPVAPPGGGSPARAGTCRELMALLKQAPNLFVTELERRVQESDVRPWGVELSAGFSRDLVLRTYATIERKYAAALAGHDPTIFAARFRGRGASTFYQIRIGAETRGEAKGICTSLERAGGACVVLRNPGGAHHEALR